jgi:predicted nucleotidyltransferase
MSADEAAKGRLQPAVEEQQLEQTLALVRDVLGRDLLGAYLHGSLVLGGLRPRSDLDLFVVSKRPTAREEKRRLIDGLMLISGSDSPGGLWPMELTIVVESEVRPWHYPPKFDFQYGEWLRPQFQGGDVEPWPTTTSGDLASLITMVLLANRPMLGPPPNEVLDPVPREDYMAAIVDGIDELLRDVDWDTRNVILTLARIWSTVATGDIRSKDAAADWALSRLPAEHRDVLARARAIYVGDQEERWVDLSPRVRRHADYVIGEIRSLVQPRT